MPRRFVDAYLISTGKKLDHQVPEHFVNELSEVTGLRATPRGRDKTPETAAQKRERVKAERAAKTAARNAEAEIKAATAVLDTPAAPAAEEDATGAAGATPEEK